MFIKVEAVDLNLPEINFCIDAEPDKRTYFREKIESYMTHAEQIKQHVQKLKDAGNFHEQVQIANNATGHSYESTIGRFFDDLLVTIKVEDPYIRNFHQVKIILNSIIDFS